jgi:hypothetical protein
MRPGEDRLISPGCRIALLVVGLASWAAGGVAAFLSDDGAGIAALIVTGALTSALSLAGRWPTRVTVSGNEISWEVSTRPWNRRSASLSVTEQRRPSGHDL